MRFAALAFLSAFVVAALAQCTSNDIIPDFYGTSQVVYVGDRLFAAVINSNQCRPRELITGPVYLYRPGDSNFTPLEVGYWNGLNASSPTNSIPCPSITPLGYGYRVVIIPDRHSPARTPQYSTTFAVVSQSWFEASYDQVFLWEPTTARDDTKWSSTGQQLLAWDDTNRAFDEFEVLLYKASDVTWGPLHLAHVRGASCPQAPEAGSCATTEFYFEYSRKLPVGEGYQVVLQPTAKDKAEVIAVSGLIEIVDYPVTTNTFPFTWTPIKTITNVPTA
ncbi:hypothetical protein CALCODRAFT_499216, partial [Calocera cornea HHB12733]